MEQTKTSIETHSARLYGELEQLPGSIHDLSKPIPEGVIATSEPGSSVEKWQPVGDEQLPNEPRTVGGLAELDTASAAKRSRLKLPDGVITLVGPTVPVASEKSPYRTQDIIGGPFRQQPIQPTRKAA